MDSRRNAKIADARPKVATKKRRIWSSQMVYELDAKPMEWLRVNTTESQPHNVLGSRFMMVLREPTPAEVEEEAGEQLGLQVCMCRDVLLHLGDGGVGSDGCHRRRC